MTESLRVRVQDRRQPRLRLLARVLRGTAAGERQADEMESLAYRLAVLGTEHLDQHAAALWLDRHDLTFAELSAHRDDIRNAWQAHIAELNGTTYAPHVCPECLARALVVRVSPSWYVERCPCGYQLPIRRYPNA